MNFVRADVHIRPFVIRVISRVLCVQWVFLSAHLLRLELYLYDAWTAAGLTAKHRHLFTM